jgi:hypothetical protein
MIKYKLNNKILDKNEHIIYNENKTIIKQDKKSDNSLNKTNLNT